MAINYKAVIDELEARQVDVESRMDDLYAEGEELKTCISLMRKLAGEAQVETSSNGSRDVSQIAAEFENMTYLEGAIEVLLQSRKALGTKELAAKLKERGKGKETTHPYHMLYRALSREYQKKGSSRIGKRKSKWFVKRSRIAPKENTVKQ